MIGHVHANLFNQEKFLINGVEMRVKFVRSRDSFSLLTSTDEAIKINIIEASLLIRKVKINHTVLIAHSKGLEIGTAKYPITRTDVKVSTIPAGVQGKSLDNVFLGQLPKRCVIGFVSNKAFNGDFKKNPFNFQNYKINFLSLLWTVFRFLQNLCNLIFRVQTKAIYVPIIHYSQELEYIF